MWIFLFAALFSACGNNDETQVVTDAPLAAWMSGSDAISHVGVYGTLGAAAPANVPGARHHSATWRDANGIFWLFGGSGHDAAGNTGQLNDLWKFDPSTLEWTWVAGANTISQAGAYGTLGTADPANVPGARYGAISWIDSSGLFWLFGGHGHDSIGDIGQLNDLWEFDPSTLEWTWISGGNRIDQDGVYGTLGTAAPANVPGAREAAAAWIDSNGVLWLFGGYGNDSNGNVGHLNDLWKFDPATHVWTWMSGDDTYDAYGLYGDQGTAAADNIPGARDTAVSWIDAGGKLWLFSGYGVDYYNSTGQLNDVWKFDPSTSLWTWVAGGKKCNRYGHYGVLGESNSDNVPGSRDLAISWLDADGNVWFFGGNGYDTNGDLGHLNDLWKFDPTSRKWTWVTGSTEINETGVYGTLGTAAATNVPGAREGAAGWIDTSGRLWFFGGWGLDAAGSTGELNDLWRFSW